MEIDLFPTEKINIPTIILLNPTRTAPAAVCLQLAIRRKKVKPGGERRKFSVKFIAPALHTHTEFVPGVGIEPTPALRPTGF